MMQGYPDSAGNAVTERQKDIIILTDIKISAGDIPTVVPSHPAREHSDSHAVSAKQNAPSAPALYTGSRGSLL